MMTVIINSPVSGAEKGIAGVPSPKKERLRTN